MKRLIALFFAIAVPASAQTPMSGAEFDSYTRGKTLYYGAGGDTYGVEQYKDDRRVVWSFLDGKCLEGRWYEASGGFICFEYEDGTGPQCWQFYQGSNGLQAVFEGGEDVPLYEALQDDKPMLCLGPEVGV